MPISPDASIEITCFDWVPDFARGYVRDLRLRWACEEMGLTYRERPISAMNRPEWYFEEQPWGQVPVLRDGDIRLFESGAILIHLAEKSGALLPPGGQARADVLSWLFAAFNSIEPSTMQLAAVNIFHRKEDWANLRRPSLMEQTGQRLDRAAAAIAEREWVAGRFSIADIALVTVLREAARWGLLDDRPILAAYLDRATARPAFSTAMAAQLAAFKEDAATQPTGA